MTLTLIVIAIAAFIALATFFVVRWVGAEIPPEQIKDEEGFSIDWDSLPKAPRKMVAPDDDPEFLRRLGNRRPDDF